LRNADVPSRWRDADSPQQSTSPTTATPTRRLTLAATTCCLRGTGRRAARLSHRRLAEPDHDDAPLA
jgi:hypothetical protein